MCVILNKRSFEPFCVWISLEVGCCNLNKCLEFASVRGFDYRKLVHIS